MEQFIVTAEPRADKGKGASRRLRRAGKVPAVLYGAGQEATSLSLPHTEMLRHLEHEAFYSHVLTLDVAGKPERAVLRALQRHPYKPVIMHADFQRVSESEKLHMQVPLHFLNAEACVGARLNGGVISHNLAEVEVSCLPKDLPEFIEIDLAELNLGTILHLSDLSLPAGVELVALTHGNDLPVVSVTKPRGGADEGAETPAA